MVKSRNKARPKPIKDPGLPKKKKLNQLNNEGDE